MPPYGQITPNLQAIRVPMCDRRQVQRRLQELSIQAHCSQDGNLLVRVHTDVEAAQVRSVVSQFRAPRQELVRWLDQCWQYQPSEPFHHQQTPDRASGSSEVE